MKPENSLEQEITFAIKDLEICLQNNLKANEKVVEGNKEKIATHYALLKAKERLANLELSLI